MRRIAWLPGVSFGACLLATLAVGMRARADTPCPPPGPVEEAGSPGVTGWTGPPSQDGSLDDGNIPGYIDGGGSILDMLGVRPSQPLPAPFLFNTVTAPYPDVAGCMAYDAQGHQAAHYCMCQHCFSLQQQCDALPGCKAIQKCGADTNCTGNTSSCSLVDSIYPALGCNEATTCYFLPSLNLGQGCVTVIDTWGNASVSSGIADALGACGATNNCPTQ
jgi:hypothetical protein